MTINLFPQVTPMELIHPSGEPTGIFLQLVGQDSKQYRQVIKALAKQAPTDKNTTNDIEFTEMASAKMAAACIVGWTEGTQLGVYSEQAALDLMMNPEAGWIMEQVDVFASHRKNFFRGAGEAA